MIHFHARVHILGSLFTVAVVTPIAGVLTVGAVGLSAIAVLKRENGKLAQDTIRPLALLSGVPGSIFFLFVKFINIHARFECQQNSTLFPGAAKPSFCYQHTAHRVRNAAMLCYNQQANPLKKYVYSRVLFGLSGIVAISARVADLALGLIAATVAIITLGTVKKINDFAYNNLTVLLLIQDIVVATRGLINPAVSQHLLAAPAAQFFAPPPPSPFDNTPAPKKEKKTIPANPLDFMAYDHIPELLLKDCVLSKNECAIELEPVRDPVLDPDCVTVYERANILEWLEKSKISPTTNTPLTADLLIEMPKLKALIDNRLALHAKSIRESGFDIDAPVDPVLQAAVDLELKLIDFHKNTLRENPKFDIYSAEAMKAAQAANVIPTEANV